MAATRTQQLDDTLARTGEPPPRLSQQDAIRVNTADYSVVISDVVVAPTVPHIRRKSVVTAQIINLILNKERERCRSDDLSEDISGLVAASFVYRQKLGEARDREYIEQRGGYEERFGSGLSQATRELDQQQSARANGGITWPPKVRLGGERGGCEGALRAAAARREELVELTRLESSRKLLQWQELAKRPRVHPRNGRFSPRELQKLSPRFGRAERAFVPALQLVGGLASAAGERASTPLGSDNPPARLSLRSPAPVGLPGPLTRPGLPMHPPPHPPHVPISAGPLIRQRVLPPPERRAIRGATPTRLAAAAAAPAGQPQGDDPVGPLVRGLVGAAVKAACRK